MRRVRSICKAFKHEPDRRVPRARDYPDQGPDEEGAEAVCVHFMGGRGRAARLPGERGELVLRL